MIDYTEVSIIIPVYKSHKSLQILTQELQAMSDATSMKIQIIFVNDSPFYLSSCNMLAALSNQYTNVDVITLRKNQGQHMALLVGMSKAVGKYVITMDDDLQHPVDEIPRLVSAIDVTNGPDAIFAIPNQGAKKHAIWRNIGSYIINKIDVIFLEKPKDLIKSPFRIMRLDLVRVIINSYNSSPAVSCLILRATDNIKNIEVKHNDRQYGSSGYSLLSLLSLTLNNILHYSSLPLKFLGYIGGWALPFLLFSY